MEVPSEVLSNLVCENCDGYLSRGPVYLMDNATYRCGRCLPSDEEPGTRVAAYEELARLMTFPCRYQHNGCPTKVPFANYEAHEETCPYRKYICPIAESGKCQWTGFQTELLQHCQKGHPDKQMQNPCMFTHNVTRSRVDNYFLWTLGVLFLVQTKVCMVSRKIYHSVRLLGDPRLAFNYKYTRCMQITHNLYAQQQEVTPCECLAFDNNFSIYTDINKLLRMQVDFTQVMFTITVESIGNLTEESLRACKSYYLTCYLIKEVLPDKNRQPKRSLRVKFNSQETSTHDTTPVQTMEATAECVECESWKESLYGRKWCWYHSPLSNCIKHKHVHPEIRLLCSFNDCDLDGAHCWYTMDDYESELSLTVATYLSGDRFSEYACTLEFTDSDTGHTLTDIPTDWCHTLHAFCKWFIDCDLSQHMNDSHINVKIVISKIKELSDDNI